VSLPFHKALAELKRRLIEQALRDARGKKTDAANRLQINRLPTACRFHRGPPDGTSAL